MINITGINDWSAGTTNDICGLSRAFGACLKLTQVFRADVEIVEAHEGPKLLAYR